ncbi:hypothetical protein G7054_g6291 [Neopestalotiopsis clavispora]|nr:hypothetical protein G7054_g6291 [Neopestalotiopsis clavispora]
MSLADIINLNQKVYRPLFNSKYLSSRVVIHNGTSIAIALGTSGNHGALFFHYSILHSEGQSESASQSGNQKSPNVATDMLDSQYWFENARVLPFPAEVRVVGEEAVPTYRIPALDRSGRPVGSDEAPEKLDMWRSTSLCLTDRETINFEVLSDGRYVYLFRQSAASGSMSDNAFMIQNQGPPPVNSNLLCDRFTLVGSTLESALEARYKRSGQKRIPLNEQDTLGVRDINDNPFHEPTYSLKFVRDLEAGRFTVLRAPTITNDMYRWIFFVIPAKTNGIVYISADTSTEGLFDLRGKVYYTCASDHPSQVFSTSPGACTATLSDNKICGKAKTVIIPQSRPGDGTFKSIPTRSLCFREGEKIGLSGPIYENGFTIEMWVYVDPVRVDDNMSRKANPTSEKSDKSVQLPPKNSSFCLFSQSRRDCPTLFVDDQLRLILRTVEKADVLAASDSNFQADTWNHVTLTYSAGKARRYRILLNGLQNDRGGYSLPLASDPGQLSGLMSQGPGTEYSFTGSVDEARLWSRPLHPAVIMSRMSTRASGLELFLEACWHFDEQTGPIVHDATSNNHDLHIIHVGVDPTADGSWQGHGSPVAGTFGLSKRSFRFSDDLTLTGGLGAAIYNEQVSIYDSSTTGATGKQMKRGARILLSFVSALKTTVAASSKSPNHLAILDFPLLPTGQICDFPPCVSLRPLEISTSPSQSARSSSSLIYIDAQGSELFGGLLTFAAAECGTEPPYVFDSATGTVTIFFRNGAGSFSALEYNPSRSITLSSPSALCIYDGLSAVCKLRNARQITIHTEPCTGHLRAVPQIVENWTRVPSQVDILCNLLNGITYGQNALIGTVSVLDEPKSAAVSYITLEESLKQGPFLAGTCIRVGFRLYQLVTEARLGETRLTVDMYCNSRIDRKVDKGVGVYTLKYDHTRLTSSVGAVSGDLSSGSNIISMVMGQPSDPRTAKNLAAKNVRAPETNLISTKMQPPFFGSPPASTALRLASNNVYSMLEKAETTRACAGLTFEAWIKVNEVRRSILVAYTSERAERSDQGEKEQQTFVLGIPDGSSQNPSYDLVGNINGSLFHLDQQPTLKQRQWTHFACSIENIYSLRFSGSNYVDLGTATEWNLKEFSLVFTLCLDSPGVQDRSFHRDQILFTKPAVSGHSTPLLLKVDPAGHICLSYSADDGQGGKVHDYTFTSVNALSPNIPYKVFVSRKAVSVSTNPPKPYQLVTMRVWKDDGEMVIDSIPSDLSRIESVEKMPPGTDKEKEVQRLLPTAQSHGTAQSNDGPLLIGGTSEAGDRGLLGSIGPIRLYSTALSVPHSVLEINETEASLMASWACRDAAGTRMTDECQRNHGKLKGSPVWIVSPYRRDLSLKVYLDGIHASFAWATGTGILPIPAGKHQLTLGNCIKGDDNTRYLALADGFSGEMDELRIWNTPRTRENICDSMHSRLVEIPSDVAVYLPFEPLEFAGRLADDISESEHTILRDASINCWHLTALNDAEPSEVPSDAPIGMDSPCVKHVLGTSGVTTGVQIYASPSVGEYGSMDVGASGGFEGSFKRMYSFIGENGDWCLVTGFRIGSLFTEWVSQVQTSPTLVGYIEGAPPIPAENFRDRSRTPTSSVRFNNAERCSYSYSSRSEAINDFDLAYTGNVGVKWKTMAGVGVEAETSEGEIKGGIKSDLNISSGQINNAVSTSTTNSDLQMRVELTGTWEDLLVDSKEGESPEAKFQPSNTGLALVESEVADIFALRLRRRGTSAPLVAYQMRPNFDIPKDRNLVSFEIDKSYTRQGSLNGGHEEQKSTSEPQALQVPKDASYYKPIEAYAMRDRIRRAEEARQGEYDRYSASSPLASQLGADKLPKRTQRNICNSYVWTADGGTYQETHSTMDMVQSEVTGSFNTHFSIGNTFNEEVSLATALATTSVDALHGIHYNLTTTKEQTSESSFELIVEFPPPVDNRHRNESGSRDLEKRAGTVDAYRWMSFWLEPSAEATDVFFNQVLDQEWLAQSPEPNAGLLRSLHENLKKEAANARTKAWRVLHRCTYVSRVLDRKINPPTMTAPGAVKQASKSSLFGRYIVQLAALAEPRIARI